MQAAYPPGSCAPRQAEPGTGGTSTPPAAGCCRGLHPASEAGTKTPPEGGRKSGSSGPTKDRYEGGSVMIWAGTEHRGSQTTFMKQKD